MTNSATPDLAAAKSVLDLAHEVVDRATAMLAAAGSIDEHQVVAYDLAHAAAAVDTGRAMLALRREGRRRSGDGLRLRRRRGRGPGRQAVRPRGRLGCRAPTRSTRRAGSSPTFRAPAFLAGLATDEGPRHLDADFELVQDTFRRFADEKIRPVAEHIHRHNDDIPDDIIAGLAEMGGFGLSMPERVRRLLRGRRERVPRHGGRHRRAVARLARRGRLAHHPTRDPHARAAGRWHRGAEAVSGSPGSPPPR